METRIADPLKSPTRYVILLQNLGVWENEIRNSTNTFKKIEFIETLDFCNVGG